MSQPTMPPLRERAANSLVLLLAVVFLVLVGIGGAGKSSPIGDDFWVFYRAGSLFLQEINPWLALMRSSQPFSYPPHALSLFAVYAVFPEPVALGLHLLVSALALAVICICANRWFLNIQSFRTMRFGQAAALALIIGNPYTATSLYQGQTTLVVTAAIMLSWLSLKQGYRWQAALFLMVATLKPQLCILFILWLMLAAEFGVLLMGGLAAVVLLLPVLAVFGPLTPFASWLTSLTGYGLVSINMPGSPYVTGLQSFLAAHGILIASPVFLALGALLTGMLFLFRSRFDDFIVLQLLLVLSCTFLFVHDYDYVAMVLVWSCALHIVLTNIRLDNLVIFSALAIPFFMPQRLIRDVDVPSVVHARTFILLAMILILVRWRNASPVVRASLPIASLTGKRA